MFDYALQSVVRQAVCVLQYHGYPRDDACSKHLRLRQRPQAELLQRAKRVFADGVVGGLASDYGDEQRHNVG